MKILVIYANSSSVPRKTFEEYLYSFEAYLPNSVVFYHNAIFNKKPILFCFRRVDLVVFHHSVTTVWNRVTYRNKIAVWRNAYFGNAKKIALMQDEYKNIDLLRQFIDEVGISKVYSVAPQSEWIKLYGEKSRIDGFVQQTLTGYVSDKEVDRLNTNASSAQ